MQTVLIVDDDSKLLRMLERTLVFEGLNVATASNGHQALKLIDDSCPDLLVVDWMMPEMDGIALVSQLRSEKNKIMVLMLTARDSIENRVTGLESGADDYLVKPFAPTELVARVHALLRRASNNETNQLISFSDIFLDPITREVKRGEASLSLTLTEFNLLHLFLRHPRQVLERNQILHEVWGYGFNGDANVLEIYVGYLRKKLENNGQSRLIKTVRGVGYVLREE